MEGVASRYCVELSDIGKGKKSWDWAALASISSPTDDICDMAPSPCLRYLAMQVSDEPSTWSMWQMPKSFEDPDRDT